MNNELVHFSFRAIPRIILSNPHSLIPSDLLIVYNDFCRPLSACVRGFIYLILPNPRRIFSGVKGVEWSLTPVAS